MTTEFTIRRKVLTLFGAQFHVYKPDGDLMGYCRQKAFKLKEDIRIYTDESMTVEKLGIFARSIIDFSAAYDVVESSTQTKLGVFRRQGMKSLFRDSWVMLDANEQPIGTIQEDSSMLAFVRRFVDLGNLIPQTFHLHDDDDEELAQFKTHFNPFVHRMTVSVYPDCHVNPLLVLAGGILLMAIEGRQS
jgi:hypothetical protein